MGAFWRAALILLALALPGCASIPPVRLNYFLPKGELQTDVTRTIGCDAQDNVYVANAITSKMVYSADYASPRQIRIADLSGELTNLEAKFTFTEDGRLSGLNTTQTGQGTEILKGVIDLALAVLPLASADGSALQQACNYVRSHGKDGVLSVAFSNVQRFETPSGASAIAATAQDADRFENVKILLGDVCLIRELVTASNTPRIAYEPAGRRDVQIELRQPASVLIRLRTAALGGCGVPDLSSAPLIWEGTALVPQRGINYVLPVPRAAVFGSQTVSITIADSGAPTAVGFGRTSGAAGALGAATHAATAARGDSAVTQAAEVKAQADIIAQNERLMRCRTNPTTCV